MEIQVLANNMEIKVLANNIIVLWKENRNSDAQRFSQYQQN
jgi:hypothetical protein